MRLIATPTNAIIAAALVAAALTVALPAGAFTATITAANPRAIYLQVGVGSFTGGNYNAGGTPAANATVNMVSVTVPTNAVGNGVAQTMTTNSTASNSFYDGYAFCNAPGQLYIGGFYRSTTTTGPATVTATPAANLLSAAGDTIPFTQISWTSSGNGDSGTQPFPAGTFTGGAQTVGSISRNQWAESCYTFRYENDNFVAAGVYTGRVTYTLSTP